MCEVGGSDVVVRPVEGKDEYLRRRVLINHRVVRLLRVREFERNDSLKSELGRYRVTRDARTPADSARRDAPKLRRSRAPAVVVYCVLRERVGPGPAASTLYTRYRERYGRHGGGGGLINYPPPSFRTRPFPPLRLLLAALLSTPRTRERIYFRRSLRNRVHTIRIYNV